jgi:predicted RNase H-like nuclease (RuvC/YqgF family)
MEMPNTGNPQPHKSEDSSEVSSEISPNITQIFTEAETCLNTFKQEYAQIETARQAARAARNYKQAVKAESEIQQLQEKVEDLELGLAQKVMSILGESVQRKLMIMARQEEFWQFIRYAGLGFALGVGLKMLIR